MIISPIFQKRTWCHRYMYRMFWGSTRFVRPKRRRKSCIETRMKRTNRTTSHILFRSCMWRETYPAQEGMVEAWSWRGTLSHMWTRNLVHLPILLMSKIVNMAPHAHLAPSNLFFQKLDSANELRTEKTRPLVKSADDISLRWRKWAAQKQQQTLRICMASPGASISVCQCWLFGSSLQDCDLSNWCHRTDVSILSQNSIRACLQLYAFVTCSGVR